MKKLSILLVTALVFLMSITNVFADMADKKYKDWEDVSKDMEVVLRDALKIYEAGGPDAGKKGYDKINEAYFRYYEKLGFEKIVMTTISGKRGSTVENQFYLARKSMRQNEDIDVVKDEVEVLIRYLHEDAKTLRNLALTAVVLAKRFLKDAECFWLLLFYSMYQTGCYQNLKLKFGIITSNQKSKVQLQKEVLWL